MTRRQFLRSMTSQDYAELRAFYNIEPFGSVREDYRQALAAQAVIQAGGRECSLSSLIPTYEREQSIEEQFATLNGTLLPVNTDGND